MQIFVDGLDIVEPVEHFGRFLPIAGLFEEGGQLFQCIRAPAAYLGIAFQFGDGRFLVALGDVSVGQKLIDVASLDIVGIDIANGAASRIMAS